MSLTTPPSLLLRADQVIDSYDDRIAGKWVEVLREVGTVRNIAVVSNATSAVAVERVNAIERAAVALGLRTQRLDLRTADDVGPS